MQSKPSRSIIPLHESQIEEASDLIARAFFDDPLDIYMEPDEKTRAGMGRRHFDALVKYAHLAGEVWTIEGDVDGVAAWLPPSSEEIPSELAAQAGMDIISSVVGKERWERIAEVLDFCETLHKRDVQMPHWYLMLLGTEPNLQGQGIGSRLLQPVLRRADAEGIPCYTETSRLRNIPFYSKHGFEVLVEADEPKSGIRIWTLLRKPISQ